MPTGGMPSSPGPIRPALCSSGSIRWSVGSCRCQKPTADSPQPEEMRRSRIMRAVGCGVAACSLATGAAAQGRPDAWLEIHVVDVGQGDAIWIHTFDDSIPGNGVYEGKNIVIDGGPDGSDGKNAFLKYLQGHLAPGAV